MASATSPLVSVIAVRITPSWRFDTRCTSRPLSATRRGGQVTRATGRPSVQSPSTPSATRSSRPSQAQNLGSLWLHK